jgi:thiol-disulfide isomerase/thioredoxin
MRALPASRRRAVQLLVSGAWLGGLLAIPGGPPRVAAAPVPLVRPSTAPEAGSAAPAPLHVEPARRTQDSPPRAARPAPASGAAAGAGGWLADHDLAFRRSRESRKPLLILFTGSDWCGWCIRLRAEVFDQPQFRSYAARKLVLLEVDFPRRKRQAPAQARANQLLARKHGIEGFPTVVLIDPSGKVAGNLGYTPGGPLAFIGALRMALGDALDDE